ncbi:MAG TPA: phage holin family protein [Chloroflexota bacterium]|nr:phage holin family protein [Chloroflexota bacterium]
MQQPVERPTLGTAVGSLIGAVGRLVDLETDYAKAEMAQKASMAGKDVALVAAGGALAYGGLLVLLAAAVNILAAVLPRWLAALLVSAVAAGTGGLLVQRGLERLDEQGLVPERTIATLKAGVNAGLQKAKDQLA